jgi:hypothetical protein
MTEHLVALAAEPHALNVVTDLTISVWVAVASFVVLPVQMVNDVAEVCHVERAVSTCSTRPTSAVETRSDNGL